MNLPQENCFKLNRLNFSKRLFGGLFCWVFFEEIQTLLESLLISLYTSARTHYDIYAMSGGATFTVRL